MARPQGGRERPRAEPEGAERDRAAADSRPPEDGPRGGRVAAGEGGAGGPPHAPRLRGRRGEALGGDDQSRLPRSLGRTRDRGRAGGGGRGGREGLRSREPDGGRRGPS